MSETTEKPASKTAPLVVFGGIFAIAICTVTVVFYGHCTSDTRFDELEPAREISPGVYRPAQPLP